MKNIINQKDLDQLIEIGYIRKENSSEELADWIENSIFQWKELERIKIEEISLGFYYVCYLLTRTGLQTIIENTTEKLNNHIQESIKTTDDFFISKMKPKYFHYESGIGLLEKRNYFWFTHTIHPIDESINISPGYVSSLSRNKLDDIENSWIVLKKTFSNKFAKNVLHRYRESQVINPLLEIEYFMWRISDGKYQRNNYNKELINSILENDPDIHFLKKLLLGILAQFLDLNKFNGQMRNWALRSISLLEEIELSKTEYDYENLRRILINL